MAFGTRVFFDPLREIEATAINQDYTPVGTPFENKIRIITLNNSTDQDVYISFDGRNNHLKLLKNSFQVFDFSSNKIRDDGFFVAMKTQIYVKYASTIGSSGTFWVESIHGDRNS